MHITSMTCLLKLLEPSHRGVQKSCHDHQVSIDLISACRLNLFLNLLSSKLYMLQTHNCKEQVGGFLTSLTAPMHAKRNICLRPQQVVNCCTFQVDDFPGLGMPFAFAAAWLLLPSAATRISAFTFSCVA